MAHELKTPLAILQLEIERLNSLGRLNNEEMQRLNLECSKTSETINSFLAWAELENAGPKPHLFANRLAAITENAARRCETLHPERVRLELAADPLVFASPQHLEQLITNLVNNALTYSQGPVRVMVTGHELRIQDEGSGIPDSVVHRLGEPFNRGEAGTTRAGKSNGLGLAWVSSICRLYHWEMNVDTGMKGTTVSIRFPPDEDVSAAPASKVKPNALIETGRVPKGEREIDG